MAQVGEEEDGNLGYADAGGAISEEVEDGVMGYADAGGAMAEEVTEWAEGSALEEDVVDVNEEGDMVWTDAGWFPALPSGAWDESAGEVLEWHEELAEPPRKTTRKEWRGSARELVPEHTTAPTTRMTSTWVDGGAYDIPPPPPPPPPPPRMDDAASSIAPKTRPTKPTPAPPRGPPPTTLCPEFHEVPIPQLTAFEVAQQQLTVSMWQQEDEQQQQQDEQQGQAYGHGKGQGHEQWGKRPRIRGGLKLRAKQALNAAARGDFHTAQNIAKGNSRRESLN